MSNARLNAIARFFFRALGYMKPFPTTPPRLSEV